LNRGKNKFNKILEAYNDARAVPNNVYIRHRVREGQTNTSTDAPTAVPKKLSRWNATKKWFVTTFGKTIVRWVSTFAQWSRLV